MQYKLLQFEKPDTLKFVLGQSFYNYKYFQLRNPDSWYYRRSIIDEPGNSIIERENQPFQAKLKLLGVGSTNRSEYFYFGNPTDRTIYATFSNIISIDVLKKLKSGWIDGYWVVKKKSAYYGLDLLK